MSPKLRFLVLQRDGFTCRYCGARAPDVQLHVDHVVARKLGGSNDLRNLATACRDCNLGKAALELPRRWFCAAEYASAGAAIEESLERWGSSVDPRGIFDLIQHCMSGDHEPKSVLNMVMAAQDWATLVATIRAEWEAEDAIIQ